MSESIFKAVVQSLIDGRPAIDFSTTLAEKEALGSLFTQVELMEKNE